MSGISPLGRQGKEDHRGRATCPRSLEEPAELGFDPRSGELPNRRTLGGSEGWLGQDGMPNYTPAVKRHRHVRALTPTCLQLTANQAVWGLGPGCCLWSAGEVWLGKAGGPCVDLPLVAQGAGNPSRGVMEPGLGCGSHSVSSLPHSTPQCSS